MNLDKFKQVDIIIQDNNYSLQCFTIVIDYYRLNQEYRRFIYYINELIEPRLYNDLFSEYEKNIIKEDQKTFYKLEHKTITINDLIDNINNLNYLLCRQLEIIENISINIGF